MIEMKGKEMMNKLSDNFQFLNEKPIEFSKGNYDTLNESVKITLVIEYF